MKTRHIHEIVLSSALLAAATTRGEVAASFARRLELDTPVALALEAKGALAPWRIASPDAMIGKSARTDWVWAAWDAKIGTVLGGAPPPGAIWAGDLDAAYGKSSEDVRRDLEKGGASRPGEPPRAVRIDRERGTFLVDTPCTAGVFAEGGELAAGPLKVEFRGGIEPAEQDSDTSAVAPALSGTASPRCHASGNRLARRARPTIQASCASPPPLASPSAAA